MAIANCGPGRAGLQLASTLRVSALGLALLVVSEAAVEVRPQLGEHVVKGRCWRGGNDFLEETDILGSDIVGSNPPVANRVQGGEPSSLGAAGFASPHLL